MARDNSDVTAQWMKINGAGLNQLDEDELPDDSYFDEPLQLTDDWRRCKCGGYVMLKNGFFECATCGARPGE